MNTDNLRPGELLHMDGCFLYENIIRKFTCALVVVVEKVRKIWNFCTPGKQSPLATVKYVTGAIKTNG